LHDVAELGITAPYQILKMLKGIYPFGASFIPEITVFDDFGCCMATHICKAATVTTGVKV